MFGAKKNVTAGEINVAGLPILAGSREFVRMWASQDGPLIAFVDPTALGADPFLYGLALVDAAKHGAKAYAQATGVAEDQAMARIWQGFDAERASPTDTPTQISGKAN